MTFRNKVCSLCIVLTAACFVGLQAQESAASLYNAGLEKAKAKEYAEALSLMEQAIEAAGEDDAKVVSLAKANGSRAAYALGYLCERSGAVKGWHYTKQTLPCRRS